MSQPKPTVSGWEIQAMRQKLGLSQARLGQLFKLSNAHVSKWEHGKAAVDERCVSALRTMIDTADHLLARRKQPNWNL
jgi:DNA-binding transcriptional regulator YiaG